MQNEIHDDDTFELRVAFDFDGVIANDEAEKIYKEKGMKEYHKYEKEHSVRGEKRSVSICGRSENE